MFHLLSSVRNKNEMIKLQECLEMFLPIRNTVLVLPEIVSWEE